MPRFWFFVILVQFVIYLILAKKTLRVDVYKVCGRDKNCPGKLHNLTLLYTREGGFTFFGEIELYRDIYNEKLKVTFDFHKCASREALDTCEKLSQLSPPSICRALDLQGLGLDEFRNGFKPPFRCPFKKGVYKINNATVNPELFKLLPLEGHYWKLNASIYENNVYLASLCFDFVVLNMRN